MSKKQSRGQRLRWAKVSPTERSRQMKKLAHMKWDPLDPKEKRRHALKMVRARK